MECQTKNKTIVIMSAIPRSGKTHAVESLQQKYNNAVVISADIIRKVLLGNKGDMTQEPLIWDEFFKQLILSVENNENIIIDNTNISKKQRRSILSLVNRISSLTKEKYNIIGIKIETSLETILKRCDETNFPKDVVYSMLKRYQEMTYDEGFDIIEVIKGE